MERQFGRGQSVLPLWGRRYAVAPIPMDVVGSLKRWSIGFAVRLATMRHETSVARTAL
ncbi:MAG TPA: hypothetical protein VJM31_01430 [Vicinamibacterales bacterium]|nr:hypothetical protein [Vicinamibacterales bacterium]